METIGTRETRDALSKGVCDIKPINGKMTVESLRQGCILRTLMRIEDDNKTGLKTYLEKDGEVLLTVSPNSFEFFDKIN